MLKNTKLIHGYPVIDPVTGASSIPKYQASTFHQEDIDHHNGCTYSRFCNPTVQAAEECIACLEDATYGLAFSSGMAAINAILFLLSAGDHLVLGKSIYGGTYQTVTGFLLRFGIECSFVEESSVDAWQAAIRPNTKMFFIETPSNPLLTITDIQAVTALASEHAILTAADNTFMTPFGQSPLKFGVDVIVHSGTKFINGHSDVVVGLIATNKKDLYEKLKNHQKDLGCILNPEDAWLLLRGVKTLGLRMQQSIKNAQQIATFLSTHSAVESVYYPGLTNHPQSAIHARQSNDAGAVLSFKLKDVKQVHRLFEKITLPIVAVSLGGVESILSYPWLMSHATMSEAERLKMDVTPTLLRLSCGIEDCVDLIEDLQSALS